MNKGKEKNIKQQTPNIKQNNYLYAVQNTDKIHIQHLAEICARKGMKQVVLSPGSRCAPLVIAFNRHPEIECFSIVDERSAAFFALGLAQQSGKPVGLICTSGSAVLNYAPAVAEAFYQKIPLVLLTADRPNEWIDQGENQSIQQFEVFKNYIKKSYQLPTNVSTKEDLWYCDRLVSEALNNAVFPSFGPVHVNIPLREPLYTLVKAQTLDVKIVEAAKANISVELQELESLKTIWKKAKKKLIVVGLQKHINPKIKEVLSVLNKQDDIVVLHESISNFSAENTFGQIDPLIEVISKNKLKDFVPEVIITFGNGVVSKKLKFWLRNNEVKQHWHISNNFEHWDNFQALTKVIQSDVVNFFNELKAVESSASNYFTLWKKLEEKVKVFSSNYLKETVYSDFKVFENIMKKIPEGTNIHFGNSTPVRYANLISLPKNITVNANRGVSGIDGQVSTALGASVFNKKLTICITGDLALMYDSNAFWNNYLHPNFKVILINNNGGNIFKIIPGPGSLQEVDKYFETNNRYSAAHLCNLHDLDYLLANNEQELEEKLSLFFSKKNKASLLEIKTDGDISATILKKYFEALPTI